MGYLTTDQFAQMYDARTMGMLSRDDNSRTANTTNIAMLIEQKSSELDTHFYGRLPTVPIPNAPAFVQWLTGALVAEALFSRRSDKPKGIDEDARRAREWLEKFDRAQVNVPGVTRAAAPALEFSDATDGSSQFDTALGNRPSATGTSQGAFPDKNELGA